MALKQVLESYELLDNSFVNGASVADYLANAGIDEVSVRRIETDQHATDTLQIKLRGSDPDAPCLGVIGKLGGIGARPARIGIVSDADGAIAALAIALKVAAMRKAGDVLPGDIIISTHICPAAPTRPHRPVPFMSSPVDRDVLCRSEINDSMDAILSIDTSRGNRLVNHKGIAITSTVLQGYVLPVSDDLLTILEFVTAQRAAILPISTQDITPYANNLYHINSIMQPAAYANVPVVGVAVTAETVVPGCATGANQLGDIELAVRFAIEVAKTFGTQQCSFHDEGEFRKLVSLYGAMTHLQAQS